MKNFIERFVELLFSEKFNDILAGMLFGLISLFAIFQVLRVLRIITIIEL